MPSSNLRAIPSSLTAGPSSVAAGASSLTAGASSLTAGALAVDSGLASAATPPKLTERSLERSLERLGLWRASDLTADLIAAREASARSAVSETTGYASLDSLLPEGRWPSADLVELLSDLRGAGELRLLMPLLARASHEQARWVAWIAPPHIPYAPTLAAYGVAIERVLLIHPRSDQECAWAFENALKSGTCSVVLGWPSATLRSQDIRRLQLAASRGNSLGVLFRPERAALEASPAPFRLLLRADQSASAATASDCGDPAHSQLAVKVLKRRGGWPTEFVPVTVPLAPRSVSAAPTRPESFAALGQQLALWQRERRQLAARLDSQRPHEGHPEPSPNQRSVFASTRLALARRSRAVSRLQQRPRPA